MPVLGKIQTEKINLPSTANEPEEQKAWVSVNRNISLNDVTGAQKYDNAADQMAYSLATVIKEWNYTDEAGQTLPISIENCKKLNYLDTDYLNNWIQQRIQSSKEGLSDSEKKA